MNVRSLRSRARFASILALALLLSLFAIVVAACIVFTLSGAVPSREMIR